MLEIGSNVVYFDEYGKPHESLVTAIHGFVSDNEFWTEEEVREYYAKSSSDIVDNIIEHWVGKMPHTLPSINLLFVVSDTTKTDSYGRQIERATSVVHHNNQSAHGRYYIVK